MFKTLLLNFLFLQFPVVIFLIFFEGRPISYNKKILIALSALTMIICMTIPIQLDIGYIFDLRYIPFIIAALYGGFRSTVPLYLILNGYRFFVGGEGTVQSLWFATVVMLTVPLFRKKFLRLSTRGRISCATAIGFITIGIYLILLSFDEGTLDREFWLFAVTALTTYVGAMSIIMSLIEKIISNIRHRNRMIQSDKLNVVSELAASVSHEMRNPLTVTSGFLQLLNKSNNITPWEKEYVKLSLLELNRAEKIVSDFLSFAKPQSENMVHSNLSEELEYTKNIITPYASLYNVEVKYSFNNSLSKRYDRNQIQQCLINLYKNAIEAMKEKGGGTLLIDISESNKNIVIRIQDNGVGMAKEEISRLGKPYYSTKQEGTGLGMLMVYSTINKVNGTIEVVSVKGKGTTFMITIPT